MIPYADFTYFGLFALLVLPTLFLRHSVRWLRAWIMVATLIMVGLQHSKTVDVRFYGAAREVWIVAVYALIQWTVVNGFFRLRARIKSRWLYYAAILLALLPLVAMKLSLLLAPNSHWGFLGISYVTFRSLDVVIGIHDGLIDSLPVRQFLAYLFFFPTISAGPIDRYRRFSADWQRGKRSREEFLQDWDDGIHGIFTGFLLKFILAALVKRYWLDPLTDATGFWATVRYMYAYSFYLFFDFAGYSAFAIGVSRFFGIHTPENFNRPFLSRNIREFWTRWHISLSNWFRDHIYMRFVLAATKQKWFKGRYTASYFAFFLAFGAMGFWHGLAAHYILYGFYHATLLSGYDMLERWNKNRGWWGDGPVWRAAGIAITFNLVCFGFLLFSGRLHVSPIAAPPTAVVATTPAFASGNMPLTGQEKPAINVQGAYEGVLEVVDRDRIAGWAWDGNQPNEHVQIDIYDGARLLVRVPADQLRRDLKQAGKGNGEHSFLLPLPPSLNDGKVHTLNAAIAGTRNALKNSPQAIIPGDLVQSMDGREGYHETTDCTRVTGWAWDSTRPNEPVDVDVYDGDRLLASVPANQFRADLLATAKGNGRHVFAYPLPASVKDKRIHLIRVKLAGTDIDLQNTLKPIACGPGAPTVQGRVETIACDRIAGWAWDSASPNRIVQVEIFDGDKDIGAVPADQPRADLQQAGIGNGRHGFVCTLPGSKDGRPHALHAKIAGTDIELVTTAKPPAACP